MTDEPLKGAKVGDWIVTNQGGFHQIEGVTTHNDVLIGKYCVIRPDGTGHMGQISITARRATPDEVTKHLADEAERKRKWDEEQAEERRVERIKDAAEDLLAALKAILFQVVQGKVLERDACITQARKAVARA